MELDHFELHSCDIERIEFIEARVAAEARARYLARQQAA